MNENIIFAHTRLELFRHSLFHFIILTVSNNIKELFRFRDLFFLLMYFSECSPVGSDTCFSIYKKFIDFHICI